MLQELAYASQRDGIIEELILRHLPLSITVRPILEDLHVSALVLKEAAQRSHHHSRKYGSGVKVFL